MKKTILFLALAAFSSDGGGTISKSTSQVSEAQLARFFTMALTAQTTGKKLRVRYPEDNISCPPPSGNRNDFLGVWLLDD